MTILWVSTTFLAAIVMGLALAHALERPGKLRLDREQYYAVQTIYYPGFTWGGVAEPLAILACAALAWTIPRETTAFWLVVSALAALAFTQLLFWWRVQPVNRQWLSSTHLSAAADQFFRAGEARDPSVDWTKLRDRWEDGHLARCVTSLVAFMLLLAARYF